MENIRVFKITDSGLPDYPMIVEATEKELAAALQTVMDGWELEDPADCPTLTIVVDEMPRSEFDGLEPWEP